MYYFFLGGKKKSIPFRRQRMEIDCAVPPSEGPMKNAFIAADDPYVADLLQVADSKIAELEKKVNMVCDEKEVLDRKLKSFKQQVGYQSVVVACTSTLLCRITIVLCTGLFSPLVILALLHL